MPTSARRLLAFFHWQREGTMSFGKSKQAYTPPPEPAPPPPNAPTAADPTVAQAGIAARGNSGQTGPKASGLASTIMTTPRGLLDEPATAKKSLLGQ